MRHSDDLVIFAFALISTACYVTLMLQAFALQ